MPREELPLGFAMALARNESAMHAFEAMTQAQKDKVLQLTHSVRSKHEMEQLAAELAEGRRFV